MDTPSLRASARTCSMRQSSVNCILLLLLCWSVCSDAAFVAFQNCLSSNIVNSRPPMRLLQFTPLNATATFNRTSQTNNLSVTIYGNVSGKATLEDYPAPDDPLWSNPNDTFGKIPDVSVSNNKFTTLFSRFNVLSYTPWEASPARFCDAVIQGDCPLAPAFYVNRTDISQLPGITVAHEMASLYSFTSISARFEIQSGDARGQFYGCVIATITPDLGSTLKGLLRYLPLAILIMVAVATIFAATMSPWGSSDIFHWTSNFGRDEDLLRLVTPGFADCLQYIQFIVLTGSLSLRYPGFYQPAVSRVAWSSLMFNESLVTNGNGTEPVVDGIYQYGNASMNGLDRMSNLVGMTEPKDMWIGMIVWLVVSVAVVCLLTQLGFIFRWAYRQVANIEAEDLRSKNGPFTAGNVVRVVMNFFLLPLAALSFYQLVISSRGPTYAVALAALTIVALFLFAARLLFLFIKVRPRSFLFDDLQTVLTYGPLYNTYCDDAGTFALVPIFINLLRAIAIGAVQQSGVAQVVLLAICEIILILTINAFRPYPTATSMNIYHACFSVIRLITVLLSIAFVPSLQVEHASRGWIGYAILLIHACVLVFGFFLNAVQTLIEVIARLAGAGGRADANGEAARGGLVKVFGMRQLSRRLPRQQQAQRGSMNSDAAMLARMQDEQKELQMARTRSRSISASSTMLLDSTNRNPGRFSYGPDGASGGQMTPDASSTFSGKRLTNRITMQAGGVLGLSKIDSKDPYYRPPRRNTMDQMQSPTLRSSTDQELFNAGPSANPQSESDRGAVAGMNTPIRAERDDFEDMSSQIGKPRKDYAVREVDFYYGVRGPALSSGTRKLKTGPADPTGPVSSATGWFRNMLGGKTKEKQKGFEVVRSARAPPPGLFPPTPEANRGSAEPYRDDPQSPIATRQEQAGDVNNRAPGDQESVYSEDAKEMDSEAEVESPSRLPAQPPSLPLIDTIGAIELPSRMGSETSKKSKKRWPPKSQNVPEVPAIPRKSSRRNSSRDFMPVEQPRTKLAPVQGSPNVQRGSNATLGSGRLPFASNQASPSKPTQRYSIGHESATSDYMQTADEENLPPGPSYTKHLHHTKSALGNHAVGDRPSSVGFVQQHRASDNIHYSPDSPELEGSIAEVHYGRAARR